MSNNDKLQALLTAVERASRPLKAVEETSRALTSAIGQSQEALRGLDQQAARISGFRSASARLVITGQSLTQAKQQAAALAVQLKQTQHPTREQIDAFTAARQSAAGLKREYNNLRLSVQRQRGELALAGMNTRTLASDERRLKSAISDKTLQLNRQKAALARVNQQQERINAVQVRYETGKRVAARVSQFAGAGVGMAKAGFARTSQLMAPGLSFSEHMSGIQASLGLEKGDDRLDAIRQQARDISVRTGVSVDTVAQAQNALIRSGYDADGLLAATETTVDVMLAEDIDAAGAVERIGHSRTADNAARNGNRQMLSGAQQKAAIRADNLGGDVRKLQAAWDGLKIDVFDKAEGALRALATTATGWLGTLSQWVNANPALTQALVGVTLGAQAFAGVLGEAGMIVAPIVSGLNLIIAAASMLGTTFSVVGGSIMAVLGALSWPVIALGAAIAAGALLIVKYWEPVSAFFEGVITGLSTVFAPLGELFSPLLQALEFMLDKLAGIWRWFTDLLAPINATQDTLDSCKNAGVAFGQALGDALMAPLNLFNSLSGKVSWLLEKLGVIKTASDNIEPAAVGPGAAAAGTGESYIPPTSIYGGYQKYQPTMATGGRSFVDQSKSEYHITLQGDMASGQDLSRQIRDAIENSERDRAAQQRYSFMYG